MAASQTSPLTEATPSKAHPNGQPSETVDDDGGGSSIPVDTESEEFKHKMEIWESVKEEHYEIIEQLPLTLQRHYTLMRDLDAQCQAHLDQIPVALAQYRDHRHTLANRKRPRNVDDDPEGDAEQATGSERGRPRKAFSSASLTPVTETVPSDSSSDSSGSDHHSPSAENHTGSIHHKSPVIEQLSSRQKITRVALLATDAYRAAVEKQNLAEAAYSLVDRHIQLLDAAIREHESSMALDLRPGTRPAAFTSLQSSIPTGPDMSPHAEDNSALLTLASAATALSTAENTLQYLNSTHPSSSTQPKKRDTRSRPPDSITSARPRTASTSGTAPIASSTTSRAKPKRIRKPKPRKQSIPTKLGDGDEPMDRNRDHSTEIIESDAGSDEPRYCICGGVSHGLMIGCDGANSSQRWFCPDCASAQPPKKKKKR